MKAEAKGHGEGRVKQNCALSAVTEGNGDETGRREVDGTQARKNYLEEQPPARVRGERIPRRQVPHARSLSLNPDTTGSGDLGDVVNAQEPLDLQLDGQIRLK